MNSDSTTLFSQLALAAPLLKALDEVGYEAPTPIQAQTIPLLLEGRDVLGQAQTGTGKTAAFALPLLTRIDLKKSAPQVLVLAPTRELAIQVSEAFQQYAKHLKGFRVLPIYGGQDFRGQLRGLARGVHVVVGTPGRVMDHMRRGTLKLDGLQALVLDEADEMLRMGFIDDVEWVLEQTPDTRQIALFSATMPKEIARIAKRHLNEPALIHIKETTTTASTIRQRYLPVKGAQKLDALTRILEAETFDAIICFVRTKTATVDLAQKLEARGYSATALNGDIAQRTREKTINWLKKGQIDILVATDVAARGLDVDRISHVINYDIPYDTEAYVHRIGRTGRAGREGDAILFVAPRERRLLGAIEKATGHRIEPLELPSTDAINERRIERFGQRIKQAIDIQDLNFYTELITNFQEQNKVDTLQVAAALAHLMQGDNPFLLSNKPVFEKSSRHDRNDRAGRSRDSNHKRSRSDAELTRRERSSPPNAGMERFRVEIGNDNDVRPGNLVGAIANEAGIDGEHIGRIQIFDDHSLVDLPLDMPKDIFNNLKKVWVSGAQLRISRLSDRSTQRKHEGKHQAKHKGKMKPAKPRSATKLKSGAKGKAKAKTTADKKTTKKPPKKAKSKFKSNGEKLGGTKFRKDPKK